MTHSITSTTDLTHTHAAEHILCLTIYNQGASLVRDRRTIDFQPGLNIVDFVNIATHIDLRSVSFRSLTDPRGTVVVEQSYLYDMGSWDTLLRRYVGETIEVTTEDGTRFSGQLLSGRSTANPSERPSPWDSSNDLMLRQENGQIVAVRLGRVRDLRFPALTDVIIIRPTLRWWVQCAQSGEQQVEAIYITDGLSWTADYNILLAADRQSLHLTGWVTLANTSGASFKDAQVKLVHSETKRVFPPDERPVPFRQLPFGSRVTEPAPENPPPPEQRNLSQSRVYTLSQPVTIEHHQTRQIEFVSAIDTPASSYFVYDANQRFEGYGKHPFKRQSDGINAVTDVYKWLEFTAAGEHSLGEHLPAGHVRIYQEDDTGCGAVLLVGESHLTPTPAAKGVRISLGKAADLTGQRTQKSFHPISHMLLEETFEIRLRNHREVERSQRASETANIHVPERLFRWNDWEILSSSHDFVQTDTSTIEFQVDVPPGEEVVITYIARYIWPG